MTGCFCGSDRMIWARCEVGREPEVKCAAELKIFLAMAVKKVYNTVVVDGRSIPQHELSMRGGEKVWQQ